jgi:hypothetical protein
MREKGGYAGSRHIPLDGNGTDDCGGCWVEVCQEGACARQYIFFSFDTGGTDEGGEE